MESSSFPLAYLITFTTYGTWLHGESPASVDPKHNIPGTPFLRPDPNRRQADMRGLKHEPIVLDARRRRIVHEAILAVCEYRGWTLHTINVRSNHVHIVVGAAETPERIMNSLKSWATRRMVDARALPRAQKAWTRHGSTRYLWDRTAVEAACRYVCDGQGAELRMQ